MRVAAWVNGGLLPDSRRGEKVESLIHVADWYATLCGLANVDSHDSSAAAAGLPALDSVDQWPVLSTAGAGAQGSGPRKSIVTAFTCGTKPCNTWGDPDLGPLSGALLDSDGYKLVWGNGAAWLRSVGGGTPGIWYGRYYPNASAGCANSGIDCKPCGTHTTANGTHEPDANRSLAACAGAPGGEGCPEGCLFNIFADPGEHTDLSATMASRKAEMAARLRAVGPTVFQSDMNASHPENLGRRETSNAWVADSGFCVPWL